VESKLSFKQSSNFKKSYNKYIFKFELQVQVVSFQKSVYYVCIKYVQQVIVHKKSNMSN